MAFKKYDKTTLIGASTILGQRTIRINGKSGQITFSKAAQILPGMKVSFLQDETRTKDWYLDIGSESGLEMNKSGAIQSRELAVIILQSLEFSSTSKAKMLLGNKEVDKNSPTYDLIPIITKSAK